MLQGRSQWRMRATNVEGIKGQIAVLHNQEQKERNRLV